MKKKALRSIAVITLIVSILSLSAFAAEVDYEAKLDEAVNLYRTNSLFGNPETDYVKEALVDMFEEDPDFFYEFVDRIYGKNDRYSTYMREETYEESYEFENSLVGIGVVISVVEDADYLQVSSVMNGPAKAAGILPGDYLVAVDGFDVGGFFPAEVGRRIKGKEGTNVEITVLRGEEKLTFDVRRAKVASGEVTAYDVDDKIGYMKFDHFNGINAFIDFMEAYDAFEASGKNTIILDLRGNPGGDLDCFINLMDNIVPEKDIPYLLFWQAQPYAVNILTTEGYGWEFNKLVILINGQTASAAELLAGSLQDLGYAEVVGEKSYGKGMGQRHIKMKDGDEAVITGLELKLPVTGRYDGEGITPNYVVENKIRPYTLPYLTPLKKKSDISAIKTENIRAVEERLKCLGYFYGTPDDVWDKRTVYAINLFCDDFGYPKSNASCKWEIIEKIDEETQNLKYKLVAEDTQLEKAIELAKMYSQSDKKATCIDKSKINFNAN